MARCQNLPKQRNVQEADVREALSMLKLAHSEAEKGLTDVDREDWHKLRAAVITTVAILLRPLKEMNPEIATWEMARDQRIPVRRVRTRSGVVRDFDHQRIAGVYEEVKRRVQEKLPSVRPLYEADSLVEPPAERLERPD